MLSSVGGLFSSGWSSIYRTASNNPISSAIAGTVATVFGLALAWNCRSPKKILSLEEKDTLLKQMDSSSPLLRGVEIRYHFDLLRSLGSSREGVATARSDDLIKIMSPKPSTNLNQSLIPIPRTGAFNPIYQPKEPIKETLEKIEALNPTAQELAQYVDDPSYDVYEEAKRALKG